MNEQEIREELVKINFLLSLLDRVIQECQAEGDDRWKETAAPQAQKLNERRAELLKQLQVLTGQPKPPAQSIQAKVGQIKGETTRHGTGRHRRL